MKKIILNDLRDYSYEKLYSYIMSCPEESFEVQLTRNIALSAGSDMKDLSRDYAVAAWIGQKLYELSNGFCYWVPYGKGCKKR